MIITYGMLLLLQLMYVSANNDAIYNISSIDKSGIYFEGIGKVNHFDSEWNLITYINIGDVHRKIELIYRTFSQTKEICSHEKINQFSLCQTSLIILEQVIPQLHTQELILKELTGIKPSRRMKRSYIDGVGNLFKLLFGTLDAEDAKRYNGAINNLDKNEHEVLELLKTQSNIIKTTISNFNSTITDLNTNEKLFNKNLEILSNYTKQTEKIIFDIKMKQDIDEHMQLLTLITTEINNEISTIINAIMFTRNNDVHPMIITPEQFVHELRKTVSHLPPQTMYPVELNEKDAPKILSLVNMISYVLDNKLVFVLKTPLITQISYDLYHVMPVPIRTSDNAFIFILPSTKYFMISNNKLHYTSMDSLEQCKELSDIGRFICKLDTPLYSVHTSKTCETELMFSNEKVPVQCDTRVGFITFEQWYKMYQINNWLYVAPKKVIATLNCKNQEPVDLVLIDTGILKISDNCKLYTANMMLQTQITSLESTYNSIIPSINIIEDDCCKRIKNKNISHFDFTPIKLQEKLDLEGLNIASHKIDKVNRLIDDIENRTILDTVTNNVYFVYIFLSLIKIIGFYILYRLGKYLWKRRFFCNANDRMLALEDTRTCCSRFTNCITVKVNNSNDIELEEIPSTSSDVNVPLRRSVRLAQLKVL